MSVSRAYQKRPMGSTHKPRNRFVRLNIVVNFQTFINSLRDDLKNLLLLYPQIYVILLALLCSWRLMLEHFIRRPASSTCMGEMKESESDATCLLDGLILLLLLCGGSRKLCYQRRYANYSSILFYPIFIAFWSIE